MHATLAADIGGTHARIGLVALDRHQAQPVALAYHSYRCADWPGLAEILEDFLGRHTDRHPVARCALAVAGYVRDDRLVAENLRWPVSVSALRERLHFERLDIVNDFEALAYATQFVHHADAVDIIAAAGGTGPTVVVGPGTGLGCAALVPVDDGRRMVVSSEAGHIALAPGSERELEVLRLLGRGRDYVHTGHVLSGPGLLNLYRALAEIGGATAALEQPAAISAAALRGDDPLAHETLAMFCAWLGSFTGDLAVVFKAGAGVYLAGGILPSIREFLQASDFRARFLNKGLMRPFLAGVPVRLIEHGQLGVLGAAAMVDAGAQGRTASA